MGFDWSERSINQKNIFTRTKDEATRAMSRLSSDDLDKCMEFALRYRAEDQLFWIFEELLVREPFDDGRVAFWMSGHPALAYVILKRFLGQGESQLAHTVAELAPVILRAIIRSANSLGMAALVAIEKLASDITQLELERYFELLWLAGVSIRPRRLVQEVLMVLHECRAPVRDGRDVLEYAHKHALGVVFDRAEEAADECPCDDAGRPFKQRTPPLKAKLVPPKPVDSSGEGGGVGRRETKSYVLAHVRVDAPTAVKIHSHVRLQVASPAERSTLERAVIDAVVVQASRGELRLELMHPLPPEFEVMDWNIYGSGSVATARAMLDAILRLAEEGSDCCRFNQAITRRPSSNTSIPEEAPPIMLFQMTLNFLP